MKTGVDKTVGKIPRVKNRCGKKRDGNDLR